MPASSSLRQRRSRRDEENADAYNADNINSEEDEMELFAKHYKQATANNSISQCRMVLFILIGIIILAFTFVILQYNSSQQTLNYSNSSRSKHRQDLKLITIYPHQITSQINKLKSQTELLITDSNREAINAIRIGIAMSNNLHSHHDRKSNNNGSRIRKRKKGVVGILLGISNYITSLRSSSSNVDVNVEEGYIPGEVVLEAYDEIMIRNYLVEFGSRCSSNHSDGEDGDVHSSKENTILKRYDEISTLIQTRDDTDMYKDTLWNHIIQLFTLCQFINNDARGYIAFNTTISKPIGGKDMTKVSIQERLEECRLNGVGMMVKQSDDDTDSLHMMENGEDSLHYASLFVIPSEEAARDEARKMLHKRLEEDIPSLATATATSRQSKSLLFEISDDQLQQMGLYQYI